MVAYLQFRAAGSEDAPRLDPHAVVVKSDEAISGRSWRRVPFAEISLHAGIPEVRDVLLQPGGSATPSLDVLEQYFADTTEEYEWLGGMIPYSQAVVSDDPADPQTPLPLIQPPAGRITDEFLQEVAEAYNWFVAAKKAPAPGIAELSGAPVRTAHRWVSEARRRAFLPPARRGQAG
ncbi:hypothetical protein [Streptomyces sp. H27-D2]|uniref:hypothetical protein n=1 Tax=Streptomyces sp. H27-D2 TaxID=3046304 RepID=UPI002DBA6D4C|nr:hypothetical protein [Streptomyces sp. H27-D2]MEC4016064.1 hypothetical protein [Streptomyces sp. H27-D2]